MFQLLTNLLNDDLLSFHKSIESMTSQQVTRKNIFFENLKKDNIKLIFFATLAPCLYETIYVIMAYKTGFIILALKNIPENVRDHKGNVAIFNPTFISMDYKQAEIRGLVIAKFSNMLKKWVPLSSYEEHEKET
ncbi:hypothetical protein RF11_03634 [Thelohanellus kitauei]|uniref:Uncharacterized protein n=1 Tax=Thelohanellus kitauei TaxID=669202 RepID=A0A0C2JCP1_THEKT|nr:hypothetical protein RF11_03634 [Thelohanellus kitauei]